MNNPTIRSQHEAKGETTATEAESAESRAEPSWFMRHANDDQDELIERYRAASGRPVRGDGPPSPPPRRRPVMPPEELMARQRYYRQFSHEAEELAALARRKSMAGVYVMAGLLAMFAGGATGMVFAHLDDISARARSFAATLAGETGANTVAHGGNTVIQKKLVATAKLDVGDVSGGLNSYIPLLLHAEPAFTGEDIALKLSGLPKDAYLTAGAKAADETWTLALEDISDVKLVVPKADQKRYDVSVAAVEKKSGELAAPIKEMTLAINDPSLTITPVSAEPETKVRPVSASPLPKADPTQAPEAAADILKKGEALLAAGDITAARQFFERAFTLGAGEGALGAGKTYDPVVYRELNVQGLFPDPVQALSWYSKAANAGVDEAQLAIEALKTAAH